MGAVWHCNKNHFKTLLYNMIEETGKTAIQCQLDTGATCNVMSLHDMYEIKQHGNSLTVAKLNTHMQL